MTEKPFSLITREELKSMVDAGMTDAQIAVQYGVTANEVNHKRRLMNLLQGQLSAAELAEAVHIAEAVKHLPWKGIEEVKSVVKKYSSQQKPW